MINKKMANGLVGINNWFGGASNIRSLSGMRMRSMSGGFMNQTGRGRVTSRVRSGGGIFANEEIDALPICPACGTGKYKGKCKVPMTVPQTPGGGGGGSMTDCLQEGGTGGTGTAQTVLTSAGKAAPRNNYYTAGPCTINPMTGVITQQFCFRGNCTQYLSGPVPSCQSGSGSIFMNSNGQYQLGRGAARVK